MFAIVKVGGKQYRVEEGQEVVVDRLDAAEGATVELRSLLVADGSDLRLAADGKEAKVTAVVVEHFRGPKITISRFKPKRGWRKKAGFRSGLTQPRSAEDRVGRDRVWLTRKAAAVPGTAAIPTLSAWVSKRSPARRQGRRHPRPPARHPVPSRRQNVGIGSDDTLFATAPGKVVFTTGKAGRVISIVTE